MCGTSVSIRWGNDGLKVIVVINRAIRKDLIFIISSYKKGVFAVNGYFNRKPRY